MFALTVTGLLCCVCFAIVRRGHALAVQKSEASLRNKNLSPETKKLMREAGYNV